MSLLDRLTRLPGFRGLWLKLDAGSSEDRLAYDIWDRPHYAYGLFRSAQLARALGHKAMTAVEFGVAGGNGLLAMERLAARFGSELGIDIQVAGFDTGTGLPRALDYRDLPHVWNQGYFEMDVGALKARLKPSTQLVLGNVNETAARFARELQAPLGFIAFDMDYYSSTKDSFALFEAPAASRLPRVYCYFDDLIWPEEACHNPYTGEYLAINEFNQEHEQMKICPLANLRWMRAFPARWNDQIFIVHDFAHPSYGTNIKGKADTDPLSLN
jgi:hypothetical protein